MNSGSKIVTKYILKSRIYRMIHLLLVYMIGRYTVVYVEQNAYNLTIMKLIAISVIISLGIFIIPCILLRKVNKPTLTIIISLLSFVLGRSYPYISKLLVTTLFALLAIKYFFESTLLEIEAHKIRDRMTKNKDINDAFKQMKLCVKEYYSLEAEIKEIRNVLKNTFPDYNDFLNSKEYEQFILFEDWYNFDTNVKEKILGCIMKKYLNKQMDVVHARIDYIIHRKQELQNEMKTLYDKLRGKGEDNA